MAIIDCPKCGDPNFDAGACFCGLCKVCNWRQTCTSGGWYADKVDYSKLLLHELPHDITVKVLDHYSVPCMAHGDYPYAQCACGEVFKNHVALDEHMSKENPQDVPFSNHTIPTPLVALTKDEVMHTWANWLDAIGPKELESPPYICKCGEEFEAHDLLMKHTAELNPSISTFDMGRAGVGIERSAHENTLALLRRARDIMLMKDDVTAESVNALLDDIKEQCPVLDDDE